MTVISIRGIDGKAVSRLKQQALREGTSLNSVAVRLLEVSAGVRPPDKMALFDDLDELAGTWKPVDVKAFEAATAAFSEVDVALWK